jgi:hypothetical protein
MWKMTDTVHDKITQEQLQTQTVKYTSSLYQSLMDKKLEKQLPPSIIEAIDILRDISKDVAQREGQASDLNKRIDKLTFSLAGLARHMLMRGKPAEYVKKQFSVATQNKKGEYLVNSPACYYYYRLVIQALTIVKTSVYLEGSASLIANVIPIPISRIGDINLGDYADEINEHCTAILEPLKKAADNYFDQQMQADEQIESYYQSTAKEKELAIDVEKDEVDLFLDMSFPETDLPDELVYGDEPETQSTSSIIDYLWSKTHGGLQYLLQPVAGIFNGAATDSHQPELDDSSSIIDKLPVPKTADLATPPNNNKQKETEYSRSSSTNKPHPTESITVDLDDDTVDSLRLLAKMDFLNDKNKGWLSKLTIEASSTHSLPVKKVIQTIYFVIAKIPKLIERIDPVMDPIKNSQYEQACKLFKDQSEDILRGERPPHVYSACLSTAIHLCLATTPTVQDNKPQTNYETKLNAKLKVLKRLDNKLYQIFYKLKLAIERWFTKKTTPHTSLSSHGVLFPKPKQQQPDKKATAEPTLKEESYQRPGQAH